MAGAFPLQSLLDHAAHRMEAAERLLRMYRRKEDAARVRLEEIQGYKREYQLRMTGAGEQGVDIQLLRGYHAFLLKVDHAIAHQETELGQLQANWAAAHAKWLDLRRQVRAYEVLAKRFHEEERLRNDKRDQRVTDESAAQSRSAFEGHPHY